MAIQFNLTNPNREYNSQLFSYEQCLRRRKNHRFIGFIDVDEYIVIKGTPIEPNTTHIHLIQDVLKYFESYGGVMLNWIMMGSRGGKDQRPTDGILTSYTSCSRNYHAKTIVNTAFVKHRGRKSPHFFQYFEPYYAVDTNLNIVQYAFNPPNRTEPDESLFSVMYIRHYHLKSRSDFIRRAQRGSATGAPRKTLPYYEAFNDGLLNTCPTISYDKSNLIFTNYSTFIK